MATLTELQAEYNNINFSISEIMKVKNASALASYEASEAAKTDEQKQADLQEKIARAKEILAKLQIS